MKRSNLKFVVAATLVAVGVTAISVYSCEKEVITPNPVGEKSTGGILEPNSVCGHMVQTDLVDQRGRKVGESLMYNDTKYFYVQLKSNDRLALMDTYLNVSETLEEIPLNADGSPAIEKFNHSITEKPGSTVRKFRVPLTEMSGESFVAVASFTSKNPSEENVKPMLVWVDGKPFGSNGTGHINVYKKQICRTINAQSVNE